MFTFSFRSYQKIQSSPGLSLNPNIKNTMHLQRNIMRMGLFLFLVFSFSSISSQAQILNRITKRSEYAVKQIVDKTTAEDLDRKEPLNGYEAFFEPADNSSQEGKVNNRRVEFVIF